MHFFGKINNGFKYQKDFENSKINKKRYKWQVLWKLAARRMELWQYCNQHRNVWHKRYLFPKNSWPFLPLQLTALKQLNSSENLHQIFPAYSRAVIPKTSIWWMILSATFSSYEIIKVKIWAKFSLLQ